MAISMAGHIDATFRSVTALHISKSGAYVDGVWIPASGEPVPFPANVQPLNDREIGFLQQGGERVLDPRKVYVNSGDLESIKLGDEWEFLGQRWKTIRLDNRPWHNYCKITVDRYDDQ